MGFQKVEYEFPSDDNEKDNVEVEGSNAVEIDLSGKPPKKERVEEDNAGEVDIEIVDDTPKKDRGRKASDPPAEVTDEELEEYSEKVRKRIQHFSKGYHDERRAKEAALRERQELERVTQKLIDENKQLKGTVGKNQTVLLEQAKKNAGTAFESAKKSYKDAYESGDADAVVEAQDALTTAKLNVERVNNFRLPTLQGNETPVQNTVSDTSAPTVTTDERAQSWATQNTWFGTDDEMTSFALGLHNKLVKQGLDPKSDEYYENINSRMRQVFPNEFEDTEPETEKPRRQSNVVAPATRSTSPKKVRLTQTQVNIAKRLGVPLELYAKQVAEEMRKQ
tara:strand:+ start:1531 stop:2538 length:1008 start_codon:yes stop_codon:yes gene_type:complete